MRHALLTTVAASALAFGSVAATAQEQRPPVPREGASPGQPHRQGEGPAGAARPESGQGQRRDMQAAPGREMPPAGRRGSTAESGQAGENAPRRGEETPQKPAGQHKQQPAQAQPPATGGAQTGRAEETTPRPGERPAQGAARPAHPERRPSQGAAQTHPEQRPQGTQGAERSGEPPSGRTGAAPSQTRGAERAQPRPAQGQAARQPGETEPAATGALSGRTNANPEDRSRVTERLMERAPRADNINITVRRGETLREEVPMAEVPDDIVLVDPRYRGDRYFVVRDEIVIVEPRTRKIVDVIRRSDSHRTTRINLPPDRMRVLRTEVLREAHEKAPRAIPVRTGERLPPDVPIMDPPQDILAQFPELRGYRLAIIEDEVVIVEPDTRQVVELIR